MWLFTLCRKMRGANTSPVTGLGMYPPSGPGYRCFRHPLRSGESTLTCSYHRTISCVFTPPTRLQPSCQMLTQAPDGLVGESLAHDRSQLTVGKSIPAFLSLTWGPGYSCIPYLGVLLIQGLSSDISMLILPRLTFTKVFFWPIP